MKISIVVPAFNEEKLIQRTLGSIEQAAGAFKKREWEWEVIVCDNNSTDRTGEVARAMGAKLVFEPINQIARARNSGAAAASGEWLIFVDADSFPEEALFADVAEEIERGRCIAGGSVVRLDERHWLGEWGIVGWNLISRTLHWVAGSFIFCEAAAFRDVGGFNAELFAGEELDLSKRLKALARRRRKEVIILHRHPLVTSARKLHLYSGLEYFRFLVKAMLRPRRTMRSRAACGPWYDGRR